MKYLYQSFSRAQQDMNDLVAIDYFFANEMLVALSVEPQAQKTLQGVFFALSASLRAGHTCLSLATLANSYWGVQDNNKVKASAEANIDDDLPLESITRGISFPDLLQLKNLLTELNISKDDSQPLVYHENKLYLRRYFQFETELVHYITQRLAIKSTYKLNAVEHVITQLFPRTLSSDLEQQGNEDIDWQKIAVANAINKSFSVIAGGPGTGKTYTVTKLLAALVMLHSTSNQQQNKSEMRPLNIALVAPTGKAAQRLSESIVAAVEGFKTLIADTILAKIPTEAQTIHRLLGVIPNKANFRHNPSNLLSYDIVLIDEVSMVDLPLMTRIFRALKPEAKVILLGDADQLPSVAAGSVLADIAPRPQGSYTEGNLQYLAQVCQLSQSRLTQHFSALVTHSVSHVPIKSSMNDASMNDTSMNDTSMNKADYLTFLLKSRRFDGQGGIGLLAHAVIAGDSRTSWRLLTEATKLTQLGQSSELVLAETPLEHWLAPLVKHYYQPIEHCADVSQAFVLLAKFRVLCATRQGDYGVESVNKKIKELLGKRDSGFFGQRRAAGNNPEQALYHGLPIMISENDYSLGLYNGDIGLIWRVSSENGVEHLMASFQGEEVSEKVVRQILPSRLPKFESVYAMTIHKTQGSEFEHVAMAISPPETSQFQSKLLSRELLYTGITRAKNQLTIASHPKTWAQGVHRQVKRDSGLVII